MNIKQLAFISLTIIFLTSCAKPHEAPKPSGDTSDGGGNTHTTAPVTPPVTPPVVPPPANAVTVGDGKSGFVIDGKTKSYAAGTTIVVKAGTYTGGITIQNLTGVTVQGTGVILDGNNNSKAGFNTTLNLSNLNNVTVSGFTTQNNGYFMMYVSTRLVGTVLSNLSFKNCGQGIAFNNPYVWDGTDNTTVMLNCKITGCTFDNASLGGQGGFSGTTITDLIKNLEISNCTISNNDQGEFFYPGAIDGCSIHDNKITNFNPTNNGDNRIFKITGNGEAYNNTFNTIEGHAIALWPASFGSTPKTSHFYNNSITNSRRYAAFEFQEFKILNIPGKTVKSDLVVDGNTVGNINTDHWTGYPGTFIDNYQGYATDILGGQVTLTNNKGYNWWPTPKLPYLWNLATPVVNSGNTYSATL